MNSAETKLQELRSKTNRQLASLISHKLDRGLGFARVLEVDKSQQRWASTEHFRVYAERALAEASEWLPLLTGATQPERRRLECKRAQLRDILDRAAEPRVHVQAAC